MILNLLMELQDKLATTVLVMSLAMGWQDSPQDVSALLFAGFQQSLDD